MRKDIIIGLVETILNDYNMENDTRIKSEDLNFEKIKETVEKVIWFEIEKCDK